MLNPPSALGIDIGGGARGVYVQHTGNSAALGKSSHLLLMKSQYNSTDGSVQPLGNSSSNDVGKITFLVLFLK